MRSTEVIRQVFTKGKIISLRIKFSDEAFTCFVVNPNTEEILKCNELFCNTSIADLEDGSGVVSSNH